MHLRGRKGTDNAEGLAEHVIFTLRFAGEHYWYHDEGNYHQIEDASYRFSKLNTSINFLEYTITIKDLVDTAFVCKKIAFKRVDKDPFLTWLALKLVVLTLVVVIYVFGIPKIALCADPLKTGYFPAVRVIKKCKVELVLEGKEAQVQVKSPSKLVCPEKLMILLDQGYLVSSPLALLRQQYPDEKCEKRRTRSCLV